MTTILTILAILFVLGMYLLAYSIFSLVYTIARKADVREIHPIPRDRTKTK